MGSLRSSSSSSLSLPKNSIALVSTATVSLQSSKCSQLRSIVAVTRSTVSRDQRR